MVGDVELDTALFANGSDESIVVEIRRWLQGDPVQREADFIAEVVSARLAHVHAEVAFWTGGAAVAITWAGICAATGLATDIVAVRIVMLVLAAVTALFGVWGVVATLRASNRADVWVQVTAEVAAVRLVSEQWPWWRRWGDPGRG